MASRLAELVDDLKREIFLRLPPHDPRDLVSAAAVCWSWRGIISHATFARDYRALHRAPPMLGFLYDDEEGEYWVSHFVSAAIFRSPACENRQDCSVLDSRHGLVLFYTHTMDADFLVCDLVTSDQWEIHAGAERQDIMRWKDKIKFEPIRCNAAVLCSRDGCDHLDCHGGPFRVALVGSGFSKDGMLIAVATIYSSQTGEWSEMISVENKNHINGGGHGAVVRNRVYVPCLESDSVVEYNMGEQEIFEINAPLVDEDQPYIKLMGVEDGLLLFASVVKPRLYLWSMEAGPNGQ